MSRSQDMKQTHDLQKVLPGYPQPCPVSTLVNADPLMMLATCMPPKGRSARMHDAYG